MTPKEEIALKRAFSDIYRGYSIDSWKGERVYFKHLNQFDKVEIDEEYTRCFEHVKKKGIPTKEEKLRTLHEQKLWTKEDESKLNSQKSYIESLKKTKSRLAYEAQIKQINDQINEAESKYWEEYNKKHQFLGITCENYADQKIQSFYIYQGLYRDSSFTQKFWTLEEFNELETEEIDELTYLYVRNSEIFSDKNLKLISVADFFIQFYYLSDKISDFFKRPLFELTYYQINLINYANKYKDFVQNPSIPIEYKNDPDKMEEYATKMKNMKKATNKASGQGNTILAGASREDGKTVGATSYYAELEKMGEMSDINEVYKKMKK